MTFKSKSDRVSQIVSEQKVIVVLRTKSTDTAIRAAKAVIEGGLKLIDIPMTTPGALDVIEELSKKDDIAVGAGSVSTMTEAADAIDRGVDFIVCPHTDRKIIDYGRDNDVFVAAGGLTPTEVMVAYLAGVDLVVVYPVHLIGGANYTRELLTPLPFLKLMPAGGIGVSEAEEHLKAGACAVGATNAIINPDAVEKNDFDYIKEQTSRFLEMVERTGYEGKTRCDE